MRKKQKNVIDFEKSKELLEEGYGFEVEVMNYYQFRIRQEETEHFFDWYHTTGSLTDNAKGTCRKVHGVFLSADAVASYILNFIGNENGGLLLEPKE